MNIAKLEHNKARQNIKDATNEKGSVLSKLKGGIQKIIAEKR